MSTSIGQLAEDKAVEYLSSLGYKILERNWRTRWCEIDIVSKKNGTVYFVEVKYRKSNIYGSGLEYITDKKLQQMKFAADIWVQQHAWMGDYGLAVIELSGKNMKVTNFISDL